MPADSQTCALQRSRRTAVSIVLLTVVLGSADLLFACTYWRELFGVPPSRVLQNIAAGLLGKASFAGGDRTMLLGLLLEYVMIAMMVCAYDLISRRFLGMVRRPWLYGVLYGAVLYLVMNEVVVPLSAAPKTPFVPSWIVSSIVVHVIIGLAIALAARWAVREKPLPSATSAERAARAATW